MTIVNQRSAIVAIPVPVDEAGVALTFGQLVSPTWTLTDSNGTIINSRQNVALTALYVVLTGADTDVYSNNLDRRLILKAQYVSATYGTLNLVSEYSFNINDVVGA
mgnify:CR=1 FL=1